MALSKKTIFEILHTHFQHLGIITEQDLVFLTYFRKNVFRFAHCDIKEKFLHNAIFLILSQAATKIDVVLYYFVSALNTLSMQVCNLKIPYQQFWT